MRQRWLGSLALSLGVLVMGRCAFGGAQQPAPSFQPYPHVAAPASQDSDKPLAARAGGEEEAEPPPSVSLDRPVPLSDEPSKVDRHIQPTGLFSSRGSDAAGFRPAASFPDARPLPVGSSTPLPMPAPVLNSQPPPDVPYTWRQPPTSATIMQDPSATTIVPMPSGSMGSGAIVSPGVPLGTAPMPGVVTGPLGAPLVDGGCSGGDCCSPGCCAPGCCSPGCCPSDGCGGIGCDGCGNCWGGCCNNGCCFGNRWYGTAEYLLWFVRGAPLPPLLTGGSLADAVPGALGQPGTSVLFGGSSFNNNPYSGVRLGGGYWFDDNHCLGIDLRGFILGGDNRSFTASSLGVPFLARPFTNALTGVPTIEAVATPNGLGGTFTALSTFFLYGTEANLRRNFLCGCNWFIDGFAGWRLLGLNEALTIGENLAVFNSANPALPAGSTFLVTDRFSTSNLFNGGQLGVIGEYRIGRFSIDVRNATALGATMQNVNIAGSTSSQGPGIASTTAQGGLLALSSNIGSHTRNVVSFVEEIGINFGYQFTNHIRGFVGYNFIYWSSVVRPSGQIDTTVNPNLIPPATTGGPARPAFNFHATDFWVQGIQFGLDVRW